MAICRWPEIYCSPPGWITVWKYGVWMYPSWPMRWSIPSPIELGPIPSRSLPHFSLKFHTYLHKSAWFSPYLGFHRSGSEHNLMAWRRQKQNKEVKSARKISRNVCGHWERDIISIGHSSRYQRIWSYLALWMTVTITSKSLRQLPLVQTPLTVVYTPLLWYYNIPGRNPLVNPLNSRSGTVWLCRKHGSYIGLVIDNQEKSHEGLYFVFLLLAGLFRF